MDFDFSLKMKSGRFIREIATISYALKIKIHIQPSRSAYS